MAGLTDFSIAGATGRLQTTIRFLGGIKFANNLRTTASARVLEFYAGLNTYLAIGRVSTRQYDAQTFMLYGGVKDASREAAIRAMFDANYPGDPTAEAAALTFWDKVRNQVLTFLNASWCALVFKEFDAEDRALTRGGLVPDASIFPAGDTSIHLDSWDLMNAVASNSDVAASHDGFWIMIHELTHCIEEIKDDAGSTTDPGLVEKKLNPLRVGFGLKKRLTYPNPVGFEGGGTFTYPPRPP